MNGLKLAAALAAAAGLLVWIHGPRAQTDLSPPTSASQPLRIGDLITTDSALTLLPVPREETATKPVNAAPAYAIPGVVIRRTPPPKLPVLNESVNETVGGARLHGYSSRPMEGTPRGTLLLVPEWWGVNSSMRGEADALAAKGFDVFVVDLYGGRSTDNRGEAARMMAQVKPEAARANLNTAMDWLTRPGQDGRPRQAGIIGWGWGAGLALKFAIEDSRPVAVVLFYGDPVRDPAQLARLKAPVLGIFADRDGWVTPAKVADFKQALAAAGVAFNVLSYPVQPGFALSPANRQESSYGELANGEVLDFLNRQFGAGAAGR
jgi:carboxymethylenebutenolidase